MNLHMQFFFSATATNQLGSESNSYNDRRITENAKGTRPKYKGSKNQHTIAPQISCSKFRRLLIEYKTFNFTGSTSSAAAELIQ